MQRNNQDIENLSTTRNKFDQVCIHWMGTTFFFDCFYSQRNMKPEAQSSAESEDREELSEG